MLKPSYQEVKAYADDGSYTVCPVCLEILSDFRTPVEVMRALLKVDEHCFMLESADQSKKWGRYTFLGYRPKLGVTVLNGRMTVDGKIVATDVVNAEIRRILDGYRSPKVRDMPPERPFILTPTGTRRVS